MTPIDGLKRIARERSKESVKDFWAHYKQFVAWCALVITVVFATGQSYFAAKTAVDVVGEIEEERVSRVAAQSSVNAFFCQQNNQQDKVLGKLVAISLQGAPPESELTSEQLKGLRTFQRVERELREPTDCRKLALALAEATGVDLDDVKITPLLGISIRTGKNGEVIVRGVKPSGEPVEVSTGVGRENGSPAPIIIGDDDQPVEGVGGGQGKGVKKPPKESSDGGGPPSNGGGVGSVPSSEEAGGSAQPQPEPEPGPGNGSGNGSGSGQENTSDPVLKVPPLEVSVCAEVGKLKVGC